MPDVSKLLPLVGGDLPIDEESLAASWPFLDLLPFPVLLIGGDFQYLRGNRAAQKFYGPVAGHCYQASHGLDAPCHTSGEACPKRQLDQGSSHSMVRHFHQTPKGLEVHVVSAHRIAGGNLLEFHIPLEESLTSDSLTGLFQRSFFADLVARQRPLLARKKLPCSVVMLDVDRFKSVNDRFGHGVGDQVLRTIGEVIRETRREGDTACRWGGEEFCLYLPDTDLSGAAAQAERLRKELESTSFAHAQEGLQVTASFGVAQLKEEETLEASVERADEALYRAKKGGRNRVETAPQ